MSFDAAFQALLKGIVALIKVDAVKDLLPPLITFLNNVSAAVSAGGVTVPAVVAAQWLVLQTAWAQADETLAKDLITGINPLLQTFINEVVGATPTPTPAS